jgi:hypothetical protein
MTPVSFGVKKNSSNMRMAVFLGIDALEKADRYAEEC